MLRTTAKRLQRTGPPGGKQQRTAHPLNAKHGRGPWAEQPGHGEEHHPARQERAGTRRERDTAPLEQCHIQKTKTGIWMLTKISNKEI